MKKIKFLLAATLLSVSSFIYAQEKNSFGVGLSINQFQDDFGLGVHIISPYFANNSVAVKLGGNFQWFQHTGNNETTWTPYQNIQIGFRGRHSIIENKMFVYGEGGTVLLLPNSKFSTEETILGGYGLFGFEFSANHRLSYYVELGGMGTGAKADKIPLKPIYSNGFTASTGLRFRL